VPAGTRIFLDVDQDDGEGAGYRDDAADALDGAVLG
jgi:hypothetical protein